ncbi:vinorine synthase-like [Pistacia vera]|uniref:vinorine synthase-like n=1 Tax=Pistacia vera TaxID=55513 RepID=UPI001262CAF8|nr:vinorine synthase-like [Pistacia vera]
MKIDVEVISRESITPCTPIPEHLCRYQFSFLDQLSPTFFMSTIYFYHLDDKRSHSEISNSLKSSLSKILNHYYPLTGCLENNYVDCNNASVLFLEAQVGCQLSQIIEEPLLPSEFNKFLPNDHKQDGITNVVLAIQTNYFNCGSVAIGVLMSHKIADASSMITFMKDWAATTRDETDNICPQFESATLFPPKDLDDITSTVNVPPEENIVLKRFVFSGSVLATLKETYADNGIHPTRVEALSSFIWSRFTASTRTKMGLERLCMLIHPVNLRKRMDQPLPDESFGNISGPAVTMISSEFTGEECHGLVTKFREAKRKLDKDYMKKLQNGVFEDFGLREGLNERLNREDMVQFCFTSLCRFPLYETDFGWGRPIWVTVGGLACSNLAILFDTKGGDGIEAWVHLKEEDMAKFEADEELLSFVSPASFN